MVADLNRIKTAFKHSGVNYPDSMSYIATTHHNKENIQTEAEMI
jgi:hypothetical protein